MTSAHQWWWDHDDPVIADFRNFLFLVWEHLGLPQPTPAQYELAYFLQHGWAGYATAPDGSIVHWFDLPLGTDFSAFARLTEPDPRGRSDILEAFRGIGKSYVTAALCLWKLLRDPINEKILVVSASSGKAKEFVTQVRGILNTMPLLAVLIPHKNQRDMADRFDVAGASLSQAPSLKAAGITGQITGSRATLIVADDVEVPENSGTEEARMKLLHKVNEFDAIKVTGYSEIIFLGTPQTEESIYTRLIKERGYNCFCFPARYPRPDKRQNYKITRDSGEVVDILAPWVRRVDADPHLEYLPTDPERFDEHELAGREAKGKAFFALQYMLDTSLSDAERYPLKQHDLIVMGCNPQKAPMTVQWGHDTQGKNRKDIPNVGFSGDYLLGPLFVDPEWRDYEQSVLFVDPSGRGKDETAWAIVKTLNGVFFVVHVGGVSGDPATAMARIAADAKLFNVHEVLVEPNFGGAIWIAAFQPVLAEVGKGWTCSVNEAAWARTQKEVRIIDTLEPVMSLHRLVVDERVARDTTLMYQLTHISRERGALAHEDRLDALAGAVAHFTATLMMDSKGAANAMKDAELQAALDDFMETIAVMGSPLGMRVGRARDAEWYEAAVVGREQ